AVRRFLHYHNRSYRFSPSSRVRASAKSARCQHASPSKVDRTDEAALRRCKQSGDFSNGYQETTGRKTTEYGQYTEIHHHRRGGRKARRPWAADARIAVDRAREDENLSSRSRSQNNQLG